MDFGNIINNLLNQMAFFHLGAGNYVMIVVAWCLIPCYQEGI